MAAASFFALGLAASAAAGSPVASVDSSGSVSEVSIGIAGAFTGSPASAFWHLFWVLKPEGDVPFLQWRVVNYGARTGNDPLLTSLTKGVFGGYASVQSTEAFGSVFTRYRRMDSRTIRVVGLRTTPEERARLLARLEKRAAMEKPYSFFTKNCASEIQDDLHEMFPEIPASGGVATSPTEVVSELLDAHRVAWAWRMPSLTEQFAIGLDGLDREQEIALGRTANPGFHAWDSLDGRVLHLAWLRWRMEETRAYGAGGLVPEPEPAFVRALASHPPPEGRIYDSTSVLERPHAPGRFEFGYGQGPEGPVAHAGFRLGLHDEFDRSALYEGAGFLEFGGIGVDFGPRPTVEHLLLLRHKTAPDSRRWRPGAIWAFRLDATREPATHAGPLVSKALCGAGIGWASNLDARRGWSLDAVLHVGAGASVEGAEPLVGTEVRFDASWRTWSAETVLDVDPREPGASMAAEFRIGTVCGAGWRVFAAGVFDGKSRWRGDLRATWDWQKP